MGLIFRSCTVEVVESLPLIPAQRGDLGCRNIITDEVFVMIKRRVHILYLFTAAVCIAFNDSNGSCPALLLRREKCF